MSRVTPVRASWRRRVRTAAWNVVQNAAAAFGWGIITYRLPTRWGPLRSIRELRRRRDTKITLVEAVQLCDQMLVVKSSLDFRISSFEFRA